MELQQQSIIQPPYLHFVTMLSRILRQAYNYCPVGELNYRTTHLPDVAFLYESKSKPDFQRKTCLMRHHQFQLNCRIYISKRLPLFCCYDNKFPVLHLCQNCVVYVCGPELIRNTQMLFLKLQTDVFFLF